MSVLRIALSLVLVTAAAGCGDSEFAGGSAQKTTEPPKAKSEDAVKDEPELGGTKKADKDTTAEKDEPAETDEAKEKIDNPTVVEAGSFRAWAEPPNPGVLQAYHIIIEVKLKDVSGYTMSDLTGNLVGTDGYQQQIPNGQNNQGDEIDAPAFKVSGKTARLSIFVPGSLFAKTLDTVKIHSAVLNETQSLGIQFQ